VGTQPEVNVGRRGFGFGVLLTAALAAGCDGENRFADGPFIDLDARVELAGFWTGAIEITQRGDQVPNMRAGDTHENGFSFPVALLIRPDRTFVLWSYHFPVGQDDRVCTGVYQADRRTVQFFTDRLCRSLPFSRYTVGRSFPDGLLLESRTGVPLVGSAEPRAGDIRVRIRVDRD